MTSDAPWNGIDSLPQRFDPADGPPVMLECMVPFYEAYIPLKCREHPERLKPAWMLSHSATRSWLRIFSKVERGVWTSSGGVSERRSDLPPDPNHPGPLARVRVPADGVLDGAVAGVLHCPGHVGGDRLDLSEKTYSPSTSGTP
jgi:hypothetical protein